MAKSIKSFLKIVLCCGKITQMLQKNTIDFLKNLKKNNTKEWFDANRKQYEAAKSDFENVVTDILTALSKHDKRFEELKAKNCIFRINRDVRFSKDKSPYKPNFGAAFAPDGKKSASGGFYVHIEPGQNFIGGGIWMPEAEQLKKIRQEIDYNFKDFTKIVTKKSFRDWFGDLDMEGALKNPPKGYDPDNPAIKYLKLKNFVTGHKLGDKELIDQNLLQTIEDAYKTIKPLLDFLQTAVKD